MFCLIGVREIEHLRTVALFADLRGMIASTAWSRIESDNCLKQWLSGVNSSRVLCANSKRYYQQPVMKAQSVATLSFLLFRSRWLVLAWFSDFLCVGFLITLLIDINY